MPQFNSALDKLPRTSFSQLAFPCAGHRLRGTQRKHVHEYPHRDGGAPEKLGRSVYTVSIKGIFHDTLESFPDLYPRTLNDLQQLFEQGTTARFVHPSVGTFPAFISSWDRYDDPKHRSGEWVEMELTEDQTSDFLTTSILDSAHVAAIGQTAANVATQLKSLQAQLIQPANASSGIAIPPSQIAAQIALSQPEIDLFDALQTLSDEIAGVSDTATLYGNLLQAKAEQFASICAQLDRAQCLQDARGFVLMDAVHDAWALALRILNDTQQKRVQLRKYNVPRTEPMTSVSTDLYGDATHTDDLLALNPVPNPLVVRAGTQILYYPAI